MDEFKRLPGRLMFYECSITLCKNGVASSLLFSFAGDAGLTGAASKSPPQWAFCDGGTTCELCLAMPRLDYTFLKAVDFKLMISFSSSNPGDCLMSLLSRFGVDPCWMIDCDTLPLSLARELDWLDKWGLFISLTLLMFRSFIDSFIGEEWWIVANFDWFAWSIYDSLNCFSKS